MSSGRDMVAFGCRRLAVDFMACRIVLVVMADWSACDVSRWTLVCTRYSPGFGVDFGPNFQRSKKRWVY